MKDVHHEYRKSIFNTLNMSITVDGNDVPVFSGYAETTESIYIVLGAARAVPTDGNKNKFLTASTLTIDIVHFQDRAITYSVVDDIFGQCLELLIPKPFTAGFTMVSPFVPGNIEVTSDNHIEEQSLNKCVRRVFNLKCTIEQDEIFDNL